MKNLLKIAALSSLAFILASCGSINDAYGTNNSNNYPNYPNNNGGVYRTSDGNVYRQGDVYRDRSGNVYQIGRIIRSGDVYGRPGVIVQNGNSNNVYYPNNNQRRLPPGQAKKIYGGNARDYAHGQNKKRTKANGNSYDGGFRNDNNRNNDQRNYKKNDDRKFENRKEKGKQDGFRKQKDND